MKKTAATFGSFAVLLTASFCCVDASEAADRGADPQRRVSQVTKTTKLRIQAERGDAKAQTLVGFSYATGRGVPQYYRGAAKWYARAAWQGEPNAQYFLGMAYDKGRGVPRDEILAYMWLDLAAGNASERARDYYAALRDAVASKLSPRQIAEGQWLAHQWRPVVER